jgi:hypothetical protein
MRIGQALAVIVLAGTICCLCDCATRPPAITTPTVDVTGRWEGESRVVDCTLSALLAFGRCNAVNHITFSLSQTGDELIGNYHCFYGNMICRNGGADDAGNISSGWVRGDRVFLTIEIRSDGSTCRFNGHTSGARFAGGYQCYQGGGLVEVGEFHTSRWGG